MTKLSQDLRSRAAQLAPAVGTVEGAISATKNLRRTTSPENVSATATGELMSLASSATDSLLIEQSGDYILGEVEALSLRNQQSATTSAQVQISIAANVLRDWGIDLPDFMTIFQKFDLSGSEGISNNSEPEKNLTLVKDLISLEDRRARLLQASFSELMRSHELSMQAGTIGAQGILSAVETFFEKAGDRTVSFEDLVKLLLARTYVRSCEKDNQSGVNWQVLRNDFKTLFPQALLNHLCSFQGAYLNTEDLKELGLSDPLRQEVLLKSSEQQQLLGIIRNRLEALQYGLRSMEPDFDAVGYINSRKRVSGSQVNRFLSINQTQHIVDDTHNFECKLFECISRSQFSPSEVAAEVVWELEHGGNYPAIEKELAFTGLTPDVIATRISKGEIANLPELEDFCATLQWRRENLAHASSATLNNTSLLSSANAVFAKFIRNHESGGVNSLSLGVGYQGASHEGAGVRHVIHERTHDSTLKYFRHDDEGEEQAVERFLKDAVMYCAGTAGLRIPSRLSPESHSLLIGQIYNEPGQFISLVIGRVADNSTQAGGDYYVVTSLYYKDGKTLRYAIKREIDGWVEKSSQNGPIDREELDKLLNQVNDSLRRWGIRVIEDGDLGSLQGQPEGQERSGGLFPDSDDFEGFTLSAASEDDDEYSFFESEFEQDEEAIATETLGLNYSVLAKRIACFN